MLKIAKLCNREILSLSHILRPKVGFCPRGLKSSPNDFSEVVKKSNCPKYPATSTLEVRMLQIAKLCTRKILYFSHILSQKLDFAQMA
jgi:hypothetical protein